MTCALVGYLDLRPGRSGKQILQYAWNFSPHTVRNSKNSQKEHRCLHATGPLFLSHPPTKRSPAPLGVSELLKRLLANDRPGGRDSYTKPDGAPLPEDVRDRQDADPYRKTSSH